jgi:hypothetical protein
MTGYRIHRLLLVLALSAFALAGAANAATSPTAVAASSNPGGALTSSNNTPFPSSSYIVGARWTSRRYDPPANQSGDILPTVWSSNGGSYVLMDDGGVDPPRTGAIWRQSLARITGVPPKLRFSHVGDPFSPPPKTWRQIAGHREKDIGPLGPYYSIGFTEVQGIFYATQQRDWDSPQNGGFSGLAGIAYSTNRGESWRFARKAFPAPLGNLTFVDSGVRGGFYPDGYVYAIGTEREFNASRLLLGRVSPGVQNIPDPSRWQWYAGMQTNAQGAQAPAWSSNVKAAVPVLQWNSHITYPQMTYDRALGRYLLTFTYSYESRVPGVWKNGAELVVLEARTPGGPFSFVARSREFGPSNGYGAGFPSQWISANGRDLWLKWAANFTGCAKRLDCSGKYGFNYAKVHLTARPRAASARSGLHVHPLVVGVGAALPVLSLLLMRRRWRRQLRDAVERDRSRG